MLISGYKDPTGNIRVKIHGYDISKIEFLTYEFEKFFVIMIG